MPGNCPASLRPTAAHLWKTFRSKPNAIPVDEQNCSPSHRNRVHLPTGMLFGITTEWRSASDRNRVHLRPDSGFPTLGSESTKCRLLLLASCSRDLIIQTRQFFGSRKRFGVTRSLRLLWKFHRSTAGSAAVQHQDHPDAGAFTIASLQ